jgi:hypothetical protein
VLALAAWTLLAGSAGPLSGNEILARVSDASSRSVEISYSGRRDYHIRSLRFSKEATVVVRVTYTPGEGKQFDILDHSGYPALVRIVERLLRSESEASRPLESPAYEIGPANYDATLQRVESIGGRACYVMKLRPRHNNKYLITGTIWIDSVTFGVVRLQGATAASVSMWVGTPQITADFRQIEGVSLPAYAQSRSSTIWLGTSELEIRFSDYRVGATTTNGDKRETPAPLSRRHSADKTLLNKRNREGSPFVVTPKIATRLRSGNSL